MWLAGNRRRSGLNRAIRIAGVKRKVRRSKRTRVRFDGGNLECSLATSRGLPLGWVRRLCCRADLQTPRSNQQEFPDEVVRHWIVPSGLILPCRRVVDKKRSSALLANDIMALDEASSHFRPDGRG